MRDRLQWWLWLSRHNDRAGWGVWVVGGTGLNNILLLIIIIIIIILEIMLTRCPSTDSTNSVNSWMSLGRNMTRLLEVRNLRECRGRAEGRCGVGVRCGCFGWAGSRQFEGGEDVWMVG